MAAGDLIVRDGQYEFQGILFNNGPWTKPERKVIEVRGLWDYDFKTSDEDRQADDGSFLGDDYLEPKLIELHLMIDCVSGASANQEIRNIKQAWQPQTSETPFVLQKAGLTGKRLVWVRPRDVDIPSDYDVSTGLVKVSARLFAADPRIYFLTEKTAIATIAAGASSAQVTATNDGFFQGGSMPVIEIDGPTLNPRISNAADGGRTLRLDGSLAAGQTLVIDTFYKTVTIAGADSYGWVRTDNQWFRLKPGANLITYSRGNTTGSSQMRVKFRDADA